MSKERPIIFTHNIREIISGKKIQTRRVIKPQPFGRYSKIYFDELTQKWNFHCPVNPSEIIRCPYGVKGDILWIKESWAVYDRLTNNCTPSMLTPSIHVGKVCYKSDSADIIRHPTTGELRGIWRSPLFMPKWVSRTKLLVERVRVQRIQEISDDDCLAEGVKKVTKDGLLYKYCFYDKGDYSSTPWSQMHLTPKLVFEDLWNSINKKSGFGWDVNPFVWVVDFSLL